MKPSKTLLPLALAAAAPSVLASSSSPRRLSGKSGKATASGRATAADYAWLEGNYTECDRSGVVTADGKSNWAVIDDEPCPKWLEIVHLGGLSYQGIASHPTSPSRWNFVGTGSYNPFYTGKIKFVTDHVYLMNGTEYEGLNDDPDISDPEIMECSQLPGDEKGTSIVCDFVLDEERKDVSLDALITVFYTDLSK